MHTESPLPVPLVPKSWDSPERLLGSSFTHATSEAGSSDQGQLLRYSRESSKESSCRTSDIGPWGPLDTDGSAWASTPSRIQQELMTHECTGSFLGLGLSYLIISLGSVEFGFTQTIPFKGPRGVDFEYSVAGVIIAGLGGCFMAALLAHVPADRYGRRRTLLWNDATLILGALICTMPYIEDFRIGNGFEQYCLGRFVLGFGVGTASAVVPVLLGEISPPRWRGAITIGHQLGITTGIFLGKIWLFAAGNTDDEINDGCECLTEWTQRMMHMSLALAPLLQILLNVYVPESPRFILRKAGGGMKAIDAASRALASLRPWSYEAQDAEDELLAMVEEYQADRKDSSLCADLCSHSYEMITAGGLLVLNGMTGINAVVYWGDAILRDIVDSGRSLQLVMPALFLMITPVPMFYIDKLGRKRLLHAGTVTMAASMMLLGCLTIAEPDKSPYTSAAAAILLFAFVAGFALGLGAVPWVVAVEVFPTRMRQAAFGLWMSMNWLVNLGIAVGFRIATGFERDDTGIFQHNHTRLGATFVVLGLVSMFGVVFVMKHVPETRGHSLVI